MSDMSVDGESCNADLLLHHIELLQGVVRADCSLFFKKKKVFAVMADVMYADCIMKSKTSAAAVTLGKVQKTAASVVESAPQPRQQLLMPT